MADSVFCEKKDGVATITLNRPERKNAIDSGTHKKIQDILVGIRNDADIRAVILTGGGGAFCAGGDVKAMGDMAASSAIERLQRLRGITNQTIHQLYSLPFPTIAAINGPALGLGCCLALACDIRIASDKATIGQVFVKRGLHPDGGAMFLTPALAGISNALWLLLSGEIISAQEAYRCRILNRVVPAHSFMEDVYSFSEKITSGPGVAISLSKKAIRFGMTARLPEVIDIEVLSQVVCMESEDAKEGARAFFEKRHPRFSGR